MKKLLLFVIACTLGLFGTLRAQDDVVTIGEDATKESSVFPIPTYYSQSLSQTLYTATAINHAPATITSIAFKKASDDAVRNLTVYLKNTDKQTLSAWEEFSDTDKVYTNASLTTSSVDGWITLELDSEFEYTGGGIIAIVWDRTGSTSYKSGCMYTDIGTQIAVYNTNSTITEDNYLTYSPSTSTRQPSIKFGFQNITDDLEPATPTGLAATVNDYKSISLSWNEAENAKGYNVYKNGEKIAVTGGTSYNVDGLEQTTAYCFTVTAIRGAKESATSEEVCATTEAFDGCFVDFLLSDSYGDGWTGCSINLTFSNGGTESLTITNGGKAEPVVFTLAIPKGLVTITFTSVSYPGECSYEAKYTDGETIYTSGVGTNLETSFTVDCGSAEPTPDPEPEPTIPAAPVVTVTPNGHNSLIFSWEAVEGATQYNVYSGEYVIAEITETTYTVGYLQAETNYCFSISAVNEGVGESALTEACGTTEAAPVAPAIPVVTYTTTDTTITLAWEAVDGAETYIIYTPQGFDEHIYDLTETTYTFEGLTAGLEYCFLVSSRSALGYESDPAEVCVTITAAPVAPAAPVVAVGTVTETTVELTWEAVADALSYNIYSADTLVAKVTELTYTVTGLTAETEYSFVVKAVNEVGESEASNVATATTLAPAPVAPAAPVVVAEATSDTEIALTWEAVADALSYNIYSADTLVANVTELTYTVTGLTAETEYSFVVKAVNEVGESEVSNVATATTEAAPVEPEPDQPGALTSIVVDENATAGVGTPYYPVNINYEGAISQVIYTAEELNNTAGTITSVSYNIVTENEDLLPTDRTWVVYVQNTDKESFSSETDWMTLAATDIVYEGTVAVNTGWVKVEFTTPFEYTGGNLMVCVHDKTNGYLPMSLISSEYSTGSTRRSIAGFAYSAFEVNPIPTDLELPYLDQSILHNPLTAFEFAAGEGGGETPTPEPELTVPAAPVVQVVEITETTIVIAWNPVESATNYKLFANDQLITTLPDTIAGFRELTPNTEYSFTVTAVNEVGESEASNVVTAKTLDLGIVAPVVTAEATETAITLTWNVVENALSYNVYQGETLLGNVTATTYTVEGLTAETTYSFTVSAVRNEQEVTSEVVEVSTLAEPTVPVAKAYRLESVADAFSAKSYVYDEELTNRVVAVEEDFVPTVISYNEAGQIESAIVYAEETDEEGNPIEFSSTRYTYNEDGVWVGYTEVTQGWMGRVETTEATLNYNENGQLVSLVTDELKQEITYNEAGLIAEVLTSTTAVEEEEGEGGFDEGGVVLASDDEVEEDGTEEDGTEEETVMYTDKNVFEYDAEGRLVKKSTYFYYGEFVLGQVEEYKYDENGNCVSMETYEADEETGELRAYPWMVSQYFYDLTINNEDVYSFEYPHLAFINWVEPSHVNILTKVLNYTQFYNDETENMEMGACDVKVYNYNPAVLSAPFTPMNITVEATSATSVELSWAGFADAESFVIYKSGEVYAENVEDPYYTIEGLELGVEYCFSVQAVNAVGSSDISAPVCITIELPAAPANLVAEATSDTTIALTWEEVPGIWEYNVYKVVEAEGETTYEFVGQAWWINYTVEGLEAETKYSFVVKSSNNIGESVASNVATATTLKGEEDEPVVLAAPVVAVDTVTETTVVLTWAAVEGALSYNVYQGADSIANVTDTTFTVTGLTADTEYSFTVTAVNEAGESEASNVATAKTLKGEGVAENAVAFNIYPNPATDRVVIATEATIEAVTIYSMTGVMVYSEVDFNNNTVNVSDFASGVYFIKVRTENGEAVQRFIKK